MSKQVRYRRGCDIQIPPGLTPGFFCVRVIGMAHRLLAKGFDQQRKFAQL
jgi:hypothetical protein